MGSAPPREKNSCLWLENKGMLASSADFCGECQKISHYTRMFCSENNIQTKGVCLRLLDPAAFISSDPQSPPQRTTRANRDRALQPRRPPQTPPSFKRNAKRDTHASLPGECPTSSLYSPSLQSPPWKRGVNDNRESRRMPRNAGSSPSIAPQNNDHAASPLEVPRQRVIRYATRVSRAVTKRFVAEPANGSAMYNRDSRRMLPRKESSPGQLLVDRSIAPQKEHAARRPQRDQHAHPPLIQTAKNNDSSSSGELPVSPSSPMVLESPPPKMAGRVPVDRSIAPPLRQKTQNDAASRWPPDGLQMANIPTHLYL
jgi:hypothetical protein